MPRLPELDETKLSPDQRKIYDEIKRVRGQVRGPFAVWLRNPELAEYTLKLQDLFASRVQLERRLVQLMILISARLATAQFAWFIHAPHALKLGISPDIVEAIRERRTPISPATTNAWFTTSRWNSTPPARCRKRTSTEAWRCSANRRWLSSSARSGFTRWSE